MTATNNIAGVNIGGCTNCGGDGGGVYISGSNTSNPTSVTMTTSTVTGNETRTATTSFGGRGGAVYTGSDSTSISGGTYNSNIAASDGGGFFIIRPATISNAVINTNNVTNTVKKRGGGISYGGSGNSTVTGATINNNTGSGIYITANMLDITNTTITGNSLNGISVTGTGTGSELSNGNTIYNNGSLGIDLGDNGVTANDAGDADTGPNNLQNYPVLNSVGSGGVANGTLNSTASRNFRINYFANTACDSSGFGEGEAALGTQTVTTNASGTVTFTSAALAFGTRRIITATATDLTTGDTSEFSACRAANTAPTITAQTGITRQQGSPGSNSQIATVSDPDQAANTLVVTVNGGASATVNGVTVSNIVVSAAGNVTADIVAACGAANASFTLRATDNLSDFSEATLNVTVTANTAPTVGTYANTLVNVGAGATVAPSVAPTDNGSIASTTVTASAGFTGTLSVNATTGVVTISNAAPAGTYTITVTTTDNCGLATTRTFTLTVNAIPTITAQSGITRQQGSPVTNSQIATVNDSDQAANTLTVTVNGGTSATVNNVTVSNIAVSAAGVVTADIVATCSASTASFTLRVTDSNGAFNQATLNVAVTANAAPTVGTYPNTTVGTGGGTTVTPTNAPADNGSIASATVTASAGFTGTLSVNASTGVVTVSNANPAGSYTVTVTFTDNCGAASSSQFTLVVAPPTAAAVTISGRVQTDRGRGVANAEVRMTDGRGQVKVARTNSFGYYHLTEVASGESYILTVSAKRYQFTAQVINVTSDLEEIDFIALSSQ